MHETPMHTISVITSAVTQEEKEQWEEYWTMDRAGTEEFGNTEKDAKAEINQRVWQSFNARIQQRDDGYYVHLPWKEQYPYLPGNKALAKKRLVNVWNSLQKDTKILDQYDNFFQDQLQQNIIEAVDETAPPQGNQVHYIPHQPVFTPHKTTGSVRRVRTL
ncbi:hypothetical protein RB195_024577 [Necator americanus]